MRKFIFLIVLSISKLGFAADVDYAKINPLTIKQDLANCPQHTPHNNFSCAELHAFAERINDLAIQLQLDRQGFGRAILASQEQLAKQEEEFAKNSNDKQLSQAIAANQREINERLLLIKWLESPR